MIKQLSDLAIWQQSKIIKMRPLDLVDLGFLNFTVDAVIISGRRSFSLDVRFDR
ncbi:unnamed protein product [Acidithrix sp. C25]|nr:unnamed protein product [Acidithrix sp. C25]